MHPRRLWTAVAALATATGLNAQVQTGEQGILRWQNGDVLEGVLVGGSRDTLEWRSSQFGGVYTLDLNALRSISYPENSAAEFSEEPHLVRTVHGDRILGHVEELDEEVLVLSSARYGTLRLRRDRVIEVLSMVNAPEVYSGPDELANWRPFRGQQGLWRRTDAGNLRSPASGAFLSRVIKMPGKVEIEFEVAAAGMPSFTFGLGAPTGHRAVEKLPKIETWEDELVLSFDDGDFEHLRTLTPGDKQLKFRVLWDVDAREVVVLDGLERELGRCNYGEDLEVAEGIFVGNKSGRLELSGVRIRSLAADSTEGDLVGFRAADRTWILKTADGVTEVPEEEFGRALQDLPAPAEAAAADLLLRYQDGSTLAGQFVGIVDGAARLRCPAAIGELSASLAGLAQLSVFHDGGAAVTGEDILIHKRGRMRGTLVPGEVGRAVLWQPTGARNGLPFASADLRIERPHADAVVSKRGRFPDLLHFTNGDRLPARVLSVDEQQVWVYCFVGAVGLPVDRLKAIDLADRRVEVVDDFDRSAWQHVAGAGSTVTWRDAEITFTGGGNQFARQLSSPIEGLRCDLRWSPDTRASFTLCMGSDDPGGLQGGIPVRFRVDRGGLMLAGAGLNGAVLPLRNPGSATLELQLGADGLAVIVDGRPQTTLPLPEEGEARGLFLSLNVHEDGWGGGQLRVRDLILDDRRAPAEGLDAPEKERELALTIPRLRRHNPPTAVLFANNGDMLRGDLIGLDDHAVRFTSRLEDFTFPRDRIRGLVWLHPETAPDFRDPEAPPAGELDGEDPGAGTLVQAVFGSDFLLSLTIQDWDGVTFGCFSPVLGRCRIPADWIAELRFGSYMDDATDTVYAEWVPRIAQEPEIPGLDPGAGDPGGGFGLGSAQVGRKADDFRLKMLDGSEFRLKDHRGKVVVLDFWATWCGPCRKAMPEVVAAVGDFTDEQVVFVAVNQGEDAATVSPFLERQGWTMPVGLDLTQKVGALFEVSGIPQTVVIDPQGRIARVSVGAEADLETKLREAIRATLHGGKEAETEEF